MTTYPLSEPATIYAEEESGDASTVVGQGTLVDCAQIVAGLDPRKQKSVVIEMDKLDLGFGSGEIGELLQFLRDEGAGLSNKEVAVIKEAAS